jgi:hypothetical protein
MMRKPLLVVSTVLVAALLPSMKALAADSESPEKARNARLCKRLGEAREGKPVLAEVRLEVVGIGSAGARSLVLFGDGVAIWNGERQFRVDSKAVRGLLTLIDKAGFCAWPEKASQIGKEGQPEVEPDALQVARAISLTIGDVSKAVTQIARSPESAAFTALVTRLLDACEKDGQRGIAAESLQDGLAKLRDGTLAPQVLVVTLNRPQQAATDPEGWLLRVRGFEVEAERNTKTAGYTDRRSMRLSEQALRDLAKLLFSADLSGLPGNIVAAGYTDLRVGVLNRTKAIQARAFAGTPQSTRPDAQEVFSKVRDALYDLYRRAVREGKASNG